MKRIILIMGLAILCLGPNSSVRAAISNSSPLPGMEQNRVGHYSSKKARKMEKKMAKLEKRLNKKYKRLKKKGKIDGRIGLDFVGITVVGVGGLFVWAGLAIPFVGWLFIGIGALVGLVGFLLLFLLGGISVNID